MARKPKKHSISSSSRWRQMQQQQGVSKNARQEDDDSGQVFAASEDDEEEAEDMVFDESNEVNYDKKEDDDEGYPSVMPSPAPFSSHGSEGDLTDAEEYSSLLHYKDMLQNLKGRSEEELLKGQGVRSQKALWDKALEFRILLQKPFSHANRLPLGGTRRIMCQSNREVEDAYVKLNATSTDTIACLNKILKASLNQVDVMNKVVDTRGVHEEEKKQEDLDDLDNIWKELSSSYARFVPFRNSSVDRWQRKTQLSSGAAATKTKFRAFNQSISEQIEAHMRDYSRMLQRMCLRQSSVKVIGTAVADTEDNADSIVDGSKEGSKDFNGDTELLDDSEFYQELLREFLESSGPLSSGAMYSARNQRHKNRKVVDRRASKGRKIRYNVHDKIVNFMVPIPTSMPPLAEKLFSAGLFQGDSAQIPRL